MNSQATGADVDARLRAAIAERRVVSFVLGGCARIVEPHDYGRIRGKVQLFCYQVGGTSRSSPPTGWRWAELAKLTDFELLDRHFDGPRPAPSGKHVEWEELFASVSTRERQAEHADAAPRGAARNRKS